MILLDTNALLWLVTDHPRARPLQRGARLFLSPVSLLELQLLLEVGRLSLDADRSLMEVADDPRWRLDNPPSVDLFRHSMSIEWTRDPFDRLLVAHARLRRWRFATGDRRLKDRQGEIDLLDL